MRGTTAQRRSGIRALSALRKRSTTPHRPRLRRAGKALLSAGAAAAAAAGFFVGAAGTSQAATSGPCDIYAAGGTPCVAAHSTTRALYAAYNGLLYQVRRSSDNTTRDIGVLSAGGVANAAAQDSFCSGTSCVITIIYDQSGRGNNLTQAPAGGAAGGPDNLANATAAPTTLNGQKAYGVFVAPGTGYRNDRTSGIATGDSPQGMYAIVDGTHFNGGCCFDYGNAETSNNDTGNGHMEAIYFGNITVWGSGTGNGPWIMADLENGLFSGVNQRFNANDPTINFRYTTAIVKGTANLWSIRGGNAQSGGLSTFYNGVRPNVAGYNPMHKEGAIILGIGGDNSKGAQGTFYEGVMTSGYPSDATENSVQANITAAGYGNSTPPTSMPPTSMPPTSMPPSTTPPSSPPPTGGSGACRVSDVVSAWNTGLTEQITITNTGSSTINGWQLGFTLPGGQTVTQAWNATITPSSGAVTAANLSYNATIAPGGTTSFGFQATHTGNAAAPAGFTLNGTACTTG